MEDGNPSKVSKKSGSFSAALGNIVNVCSALSTEDSLRIFYTAKEGIVSSTKVIRELGLTQKRYYTRLNELMKAGLIQKEENVYHYTSLGKMLYNLGSLFAEALNHGEQLELIDKVRSSPSLSLTERERVIEALSKEGLNNFVDLLSGGIKPVGIVTRFEDITAGTIRLLERAEKEVYLATRYSDLSVVEAILRCLNQGVQIHCLDGDKRNLSSKTHVLRMVISNPLKIKKFYQILHSPNIRIKYIDLPYSFIVVDGNYVGFELVNPFKDEFFIGLFLENDFLGKKFIEVFGALYEKAVEDPMKAFIKELNV